MVFPYRICFREADLLKKPKAEVQNLHNPSLEAASLEADLILEADLVWKQIHPNLWDIYHNPNLWDTLPRPNLLLSPTVPFLSFLHSCPPC